MTDNTKAYDQARDALRHVSTANLENLKDLADTPAKAQALADEAKAREAK